MLKPKHPFRNLVFMSLKEFDRLVNCRLSQRTANEFNHHTYQVRVISLNYARPLCTSFHCIDETSEISKSVNNLSQSVLG